MYKNDTYKPYVDIKLNNGLYFFIPESATGKTRLCNIFKTIQAYGEPVVSYTFNDKLAGFISLEEILKDSRYKVILLDRYDMYLGYLWDEIKERSKSSIILVDCKQQINDSMIMQNYCNVKLYVDRVEVVN